MLKRSIETITGMPLFGLLSKLKLLRLDSFNLAFLKSSLISKTPAKHANRVSLLFSFFLLFHVTSASAATGIATITSTGLEEQGQTLMAAVTDADGTTTSLFSYQWARNTVNVSGANAQTYGLTQDDVGTSITVIVSYTDDLLNPENITSAATGSIANINDSPTGSVVINGVPTEGQTLTASDTIADADTLGTFGYQWKSGGVDVGTNSTTYILLGTDVGNTLTVTVSYTDGGGTPESLISAATGGVSAANSSPTGSVVINGVPTEGQTLTATNDIADADTLGTFSYQWKSSGADVGTNSATYILLGSDVGNTLTVTVSYTDGGGTPESLISTATGAVSAANSSPTGSVVINGVPTEGQTLTATNDIADADTLGTFSYQWKSAGIPVGSSVSTYLLQQSDVGNIITVTISYVDGGGTLESVDSLPTTAVVDNNQTPTGSILISGTLTDGQTLTATNDIADADTLGTFSYQWKSAGAPVGSSVSTYLLQQSDVGNVITVTISYVDGGGTLEMVDSVPTTPVINVNDAPTGAVTISGSAVQGQVLTATDTIADIDGLGPFSYQWLRGGVDITNATLVTYTPIQADVNALISVRVTYTDVGATPEMFTSLPTTAIVDVNDFPVGFPIITGEVKQGELLTADTSGISDADGLGAFSYQWLRGGLVIPGANVSTYTLLQADVAALISVTVSYTDGGSTVESVTSLETVAVVNVNDLPVGVPIVIGDLSQGELLTADITNITDADGLGVFNYQWLRGGLEIVGATTSTYTLVQLDVGALISVRVSYIDGDATEEILVSDEVDPVININDLGVVTIVGEATVAADVPLTVGEILDADGTVTATTDSSFAYQWLLANSDNTGLCVNVSVGEPISGATSDTYSITNSDLGKCISLRVTYTDDFFTDEIVISNVKGPIFPDVPIVSPPTTIGPIPATGWFTLIDVDPQLSATARDGLDGGIIPVPGSNGQFRPGENLVTWSATDSAGNVGTATQIVRVIPLAEVRKIQQSAEGSSAEFKVFLNGDALQYPVTVSYMVSDTGTAANDGSDHNLVAATATILQPVSGELPEVAVPFSIVDDGPGEGTETILVALTGTPGNAVLGKDIEHTIQIIEGNVAPSVTLKVSQLQFDLNSNPVMVVVSANDANVGETATLTYDWSGTDNAIANANGEMFTINPADLSPGFYDLLVTVGDGTTTTSATVTLSVLSELLLLSSEEDADGDSINDAVEGFTDSDSDGIADYLDAIQAGHVIQLKAGLSNEFLMQTETGLKLSLGEIAFKANRGGTLVEEIDVSNPAIGGNVNSDTDTVENIGGYSDFIVTGLSFSGQVVKVVMPQLAAMPRAPIYRKLTSAGWQDFVQDSNNKIASAVGEEGYCPSPGSAEYQPGLSEGHWCLELTIEDGGPNDTDGESNRSISDPGGVGRILSSVTVSSSGGGGGSINPLLAILTLLILLAVRVNTRQVKS